MSTTVGLAPLLPVTGTFVIPFTAYFALLSLRVVQLRQNPEDSLGDTKGKAVDAAGVKGSALFKAVRCHSNFAENVPLALLLAAVAELNGGNAMILTGSLSALFVFRVLHSEAGMLVGKESNGPGRAIGHAGTIGTLLCLAGYNTFLTRSFWGL